MLIRTQDKRNLIDITGGNVCIQESLKQTSEERIKYYNIVCSGYYTSLGTYSTKEKAIQVIDMIEEAYLEPTYINKFSDNEYAKHEYKVFHMPADCEGLEYLK